MKIVVPKGVAILRADGTTRTWNFDLIIKKAELIDGVYHFLWLSKKCSVPADKVIVK
jgi:hypothetical protein